MMKKIVFSVILLSSSIYTNAQQLLEVLKHQTIDIAFTLPSGVSIEKGRYIVASTLDSNYLPFSAPTTPATWDRNIDPDATAEAKTLDFQGIIPEHGVLVHIPITVASVGTNPKIPAYTQTINIPAWKTEDGNSRNLTLSWTEQPYDANTKFIRAILKPDGELKVKKLDLNAGLGNDYQGVELGVFNYTYNYTNGASSGSSKFEVRALAGIPDRNINTGNPMYQSIYLPILGADGKIWLNNNLGAGYSNILNVFFNPTQQAKSIDDHLAFGYLYQWQRSADGHERVIYFKDNPPFLRCITNQCDLSIPAYKNSLSDTWQPKHGRFIIDENLATFWYDDKKVPNTVNLWQKDGTNNPCPVGFHVPTLKEYETLKSATNVGNNLVLPYAGIRYTAIGNSEEGVHHLGNRGFYWTSSVQAVDDPSPYSFVIAGSRDNQQGPIRESANAYGLSIRCIQD